MALLARHRLAAALVLAAFAATAAVFAFARPQYRPESHGPTIELPARTPPPHVAGPAGWVWPDGVPGWKAGETVEGVDVSYVQPVEVYAAELAAARRGLDADEVRVLSPIRPNDEGTLAILAAPTKYEKPPRTCLAALLQGDAPVVWRCPGARPTPDDLGNARVLVAVTRLHWPDGPKGEQRNPIYLSGVARGDVDRIVLVAAGTEPTTVYERGNAWGDFSATPFLDGGPARLGVYTSGRLVQTLPLDLRPREQRVLR
jgi:hypothetical protein